MQSDEELKSTAVAKKKKKKKKKRKKQAATLYNPEGQRWVADLELQPDDSPQKQETVKLPPL